MRGQVLQSHIRPNLALNRSAVTMRFYFSASRAPRPVSFALGRHRSSGAGCLVFVFSPSLRRLSSVVNLMLNQKQEASP